MAGEISRSYHDELRAEERQRVALRIANGTKASSPQIISHRRQHPDYTGSGGDAVGSFNSPFFANKDESDKQLSGGVLRHFDYAQRILKQRAQDDLARTAEKEGIPSALSGIQGEPPILSERESRELELNQLLSALQDEIESGNVGSIAFTEVRQIPRLLISLTPGFSAQELARLRRFIGDMIGDVEVEATRTQDELLSPAAAAEADEAADRPLPREERTNITRINAFLRNILEFIKIAEDDVGSDPPTRVARAKAVAKVLFDPKKVFVRQAVVSSLVRTVGRLKERFDLETVPATIKSRQRKSTLSSVRTEANNTIELASAFRVGRIAKALGITTTGLSPPQAKVIIQEKIKTTPIRELRRVFNIIDEQIWFKRTRRTS